MKNKFIILLAMSSSLFLFSQVGINTPNPQGTFHIDGAKDNPATGIPSVIQQANDMVVTNTGDLGVGITVPTTKMHIVSNTANLNRYTLIDAPAGGNSLTIMALRNTAPLATGNFSLLGFTNNGPTSGGANWGIGSIRTSTAEDFYMGNSLGGGYLERLRITSSGDVGIGINAPTRKLDINGDLRVRNVPVGSPGIDQIGVDSNGNVVKVPASESTAIVVRGEILGAHWHQVQTVPATLAPAGYPYLKSVTVSLFNAQGKAAITGILVKQNQVLACSGIGGFGTNICTTSNPAGGTMSVDVTSAPGFTITLSNNIANGIYSNLYYTAEYSKY
ncbi:hypothetical protein [Chryseobacterium lathyri]|uniref:Uncharacterized protein n=1 Tax=Chryseobacterium lathyri TaxID=395933 RepID=A0ABT9SN03_9FLAO|nr:hypothetical protein [Chryseobacterium lathyri]MDP9960827.1 hypothetical protein [Chryseobacterium lathyri]